jgi:hypothetical protein
VGRGTSTLRRDDPGTLSAVRALAVTVCALAGVSLAACSASAVHGADQTSTTTAAPTSTAPTTTSASSSSTSVPTGVQNLTVTDAIRSQLVAAGAQLNSLPESDYTGLRAGETYYAYDPVAKVYWAGAGLDPSMASTPAQVSTQDDGAYLLFERPAAGPWKAYDVGLAGTEGATCPVQVPAAILQLWQWAPGSCRPRTIL